MTWKQLIKKIKKLENLKVKEGEKCERPKEEI